MARANPAGRRRKAVLFASKWDGQHSELVDIAILALAGLTAALLVITQFVGTDALAQMFSG